MPDSEALRSRRSRAHAAGDHGLCTARCRLRVAGPGDVDALVAAVDLDFPDDGADPLVRELARRLALIGARGHGVAAVTALRALGELVAAQRDAS